VVGAAAAGAAQHADKIAIEISFFIFGVLLFCSAGLTMPLRSRI